MPTKLSDNIKQVWQIVGNESRFVGTLDLSTGMYQYRGKGLQTMVWWPARVVTYGVEEWEQIRRDVKFIELIDKPAKKLYHCSGDIARSQGQWYDTPRGRRWGVPLDYFVEQ